MKILLASHSERRRAILSMFGIPFRVAVPEVTEAYTGFPEPDELVMGLACRKARAARALVRPGECIIAADTVVVRGGAVLGKPQTVRDAFDGFAFFPGPVTKFIRGSPFFAKAAFVLQAEKQTCTSASCPRGKSQPMSKPENRSTKQADMGFRNAVQFSSTVLKVIIST